MPESRLVEFIEHVFPHMTERGMPQVMTQGNCLRQVLVKVQGSGYGTGYLGDLQGMGKACHVVVTQRGDKNLRFVFEPAERLAVNNAVAITLKGSTHRAWLFVLEPAPRQPASDRMR